jgi:hypothetical protein
MTLYLLTTKGLGDFYIIAKDSLHATNVLGLNLDKADYGFSSQREVENIKIIAKEITTFSEGKLNFSSGNKLIL